jgi:hypothetical protein
MTSNSDIIKSVDLVFLDDVIVNRLYYILMLYVHDAVPFLLILITSLLSLASLLPCHQNFLT